MNEKLTGKEKRQVATLSEIMNVTCAKTNKLIEVGESVKVFNWGCDGEFLGYGKFIWDEFERQFQLAGDPELNQTAGIDFHGVEDNYDAFRAPVEKLTEKERKKLMN